MDYSRYVYTYINHEGFVYTDVFLDATIVDSKKVAGSIAKDFAKVIERFHYLIEEENHNPDRPVGNEKRNHFAKPLWGTESGISHLLMLSFLSKVDIKASTHHSQA